VLFAGGPFDAYLKESASASGPRPQAYLSGARADETTLWPGGWTRKTAKSHGIRYDD
jgi:hypothetical protein